MIVIFYFLICHIFLQRYVVKMYFPMYFFYSLEAGLLVSLCDSVQKKTGVFTKCSTFYAFEMK